MVTQASPATKGSQPRLSAAVWEKRALELLVAEGPASVKIARLCADLGVTKGSFYWHFADIDALMTTVATTWCAETRELLVQLDVIQHVPPLDRLRAMALRLVDDTSWQTERALREWARLDPMVAKVLEETEAFIFETVQATLVDMGASAEAARLRAGLLVYAGIGFAHGGHALPKPEPADIDDLIAFVAIGLDLTAGENDQTQRPQP
ncbi:hypothetical protein Back2_00160 [Nocardioides baekrokdamisoli]|uniref:HTH tetR-type domain-containing protein n=1 Tax=Nocardioides baekrokdamisoli TaxID=1804624 RepID=A0A3G9IYB5_9ACTN|nr:TetR/AcrR family transcriptional regulator [Nocardioides baekrokdamisoli]BBH15729.1 hypothetical protein Back2_00160 [Nocardioides baekrokdamisoli]